MYTKRVLRDFYMSYERRLVHLGLKSLEHSRLYLDLVLLYKIVHGLSILHDMGIYSPSSSHRLRGHGWLLHPVDVARFSLCMQSFVYSGCRLWNALPKTAYQLSLPLLKSVVYNLNLVHLRSCYTQAMSASLLMTMSQ